jgi:DNA topoisomerase-1
MQATRGKKETTDHPPIHPTQAVHPNALGDGPKRRVYELIVRRFIATFGPPMVTESTRADIEAGSESYFVRGSVVLDPGFARIYTYARSSDDEIPKLEEGQELALDGEPWSVGKETQPPSRISQGKLIELMEERGLGTKATRADIIQKLYDRGYVYGNPPEPSETGIALYQAFHHYVPRMATPEMTAELEADMDKIAAGETSKDEVVRISREMLHTTTTELEEKREDLAKHIWAGMDEDKFLGPCKVCEAAGRKRENGEPNRLRIIDLKGGKRMYGCEGWIRPPETKEGEPPPPPNPDSCPVSGPLPGRFFELWRLEDRCSVCEQMPRLTVKKRGGRPWKLCLNDDCPTMVEMREKRAQQQAAREARDAAKAAGENGAAEAAGDEAPAKGKGGRPRRPRKPAPTTARTKRAGSSSKR